MLVKPITFMNNCGQAAKLLLDTYKLPLDNLLVVYDDMDLSLGRIKFTKRGSSGGHRGMASIIEELGTQEINRLRIGISKPLRCDPVDYVLSPFREEEKEVLNDTLERAASACCDWLNYGSDFVMQKYNVRVRSLS
jgi:PTH1 family peptidyl-tRNA hydrolase